MIEEELGKPGGFDGNHYSKPLTNTDVLLCIKDLAKNYGKEIEERFSKAPPGYVEKASKIPEVPMVANAPVIPGLGSVHMYNFIGSLFFFGFKKPLIECLKELSNIQGGQYKMGI